MRDLSLHLLDIMQNSTAANARRIKVVISAGRYSGKLSMTVEDDGDGMDEELLKSVADPFVTTRSTRRTGMGIPLFKAAAQRAGGDVEIASEPGGGTTVKAEFGIENIDRPPLGSIPYTVMNMIAANPDISLEVVLENEGERFVFSTRELREKLGEVPLNRLEVLEWISGYVEEGIKVIFGGVLDEITC
jgi:hypothetical protein